MEDAFFYRFLKISTAFKLSKKYAACNLLKTTCNLHILIYKCHFYRVYKNYMYENVI